MSDCTCATDPESARVWCRSAGYSAKYTAALVNAVAITRRCVREIDNDVWQLIHEAGGTAKLTPADAAQRLTEERP